MDPIHKSLYSKDIYMEKCAHTICPQTTIHLILIFTSILVLGFRHIFFIEILSKAKLHHLRIIFLVEMYTRLIFIFLTSASSISHQQDWCFTEYYRNVIHQDISIQNIQYTTTQCYSLCAPKTLYICGWKCWRYSTAYNMNWISI